MKNASKAEKLKFMIEYADNFKLFVINAIEDEINYDFEDHNAFLKACLETFIDLNEEE